MSSSKWLVVMVFCIIASTVMSSPFEALSRTNISPQYKKIVHNYLNSTILSAKDQKLITGAERVGNIVPQDILWVGDTMPYVSSISITDFSVMGGYWVTLSGVLFADPQFTDCKIWNDQCGVFFQFSIYELEPNNPNKWPVIINDNTAVAYVPPWGGAYIQGSDFPWDEFKTDIPVSICSILFSPYYAEGIPLCSSFWLWEFPHFSYHEPVITGVTPNLWCNNGKTKLTITGQYFGGRSDLYSYISVQTGETASPKFTSFSDTFLISGTLPAQPSNTLGPMRSAFLAWSVGPYEEIQNAGQYSPAASGC